MSAVNVISVSACTCLMSCSSCDRSGNGRERREGGGGGDETVAARVQSRDAWRRDETEGRRGAKEADTRAKEGTEGVRGDDEIEAEGREERGGGGVHVEGATDDRAQRHIRAASAAGESPKGDIGAKVAALALEEDSSNGWRRALSRLDPPISL